MFSPLLNYCNSYSSPKRATDLPNQSQKLTSKTARSWLSGGVELFQEYQVPGNEEEWGVRTSLPQQLTFIATLRCWDSEHSVFLGIITSNMHDPWGSYSYYLSPFGMILTPRSPTVTSQCMDSFPYNYECVVE